MATIDDVYKQVTEPILQAFPKIIKAAQPIGEALLGIAKNQKVEYFKVDEWYFAALPSKQGTDWIVWCAKSPLTASNPLSEPEDTEIWFERSGSKEEAISLLKKEVGIGN